MVDNSKIISAVLAKNNLPSTVHIARYPSGIIHDTYDVGGCVLKIEGEAEYAKGVLKYQPEVLSKLLSVGAKVPRIIDSGVIEGKQYLLMEKLKGTNIVYGWRDFDMKQKENFIAQLVEELKKYHSLAAPQYSLPICSSGAFLNFKDAFQRIISFDKIKIDTLSSEHRKDVGLLKKFYENNIAVLNEVNTAVFIHNDIHLENIFYEGNKITGIIDFDWASYAPKDYELRHITQTFRYPLYTVEEKLEPLYENYQMIEEFRLLKKHYPALFEHTNLAARIRLYYLEKILDRLVGWRGNNDKALQIFSEEMRDIYRTDWLERLLAN